MNDGMAVALAAIGVLGAAVAGIVWVAKFGLQTLSKDLREHTKAALKQVEASKKATETSERQLQASQEVLIFMRNLNGKLAKATIQTVQEQTVEHQTINVGSQK